MIRFSCNIIVIVVWLLALGTSCEKKKENSSEKPFVATPYVIQVPPFFPTNLNIPADNPMTVEGVALGKKLFEDGRLCGRLNTDSLMSCATCHLQKNAYECGLDHNKFVNGQPFGLTGNPTFHTMLPLINLVFNNSGYGWSGYINQWSSQYGNAALGVPETQPYNYKNIESFVWMMIVDPSEGSGSIARSLATIASLKEYSPLFKAAFGTEEITIDRISKATAQYVRTLISSNSRFDKYMRGEIELTDGEMRGYILFTTESGADCFHCHGGFGNVLFTTNTYANNGLDLAPNGLYDRYSVTKNPNDKGLYKIPTLRNVEYTAPYMHDGRFKTLEEVVDFYSEGVQISPTLSPLMHHAAQGGLHLTPTQKKDLIAFLKSLSDPEFIKK